MGMSKEGKDFILDLNMYLMMSGRSEKEIREFIDEAEQHLILGEKEGKSVKDIFGDSPKEYAKSVEKELSYDIKETLNFGCMIIILMGSWMFLNGLDYGAYKCSILEAIGTPLIYILMFFSLIMMGKKYAFDNKKFGILTYILMVFNIGALVAIGIVSKKLPQIEIINEQYVKWTIFILFLVCVFMALKIGSIATMFPFVINLPKVLYYFFNINISNLDGVISIGGAILMFLIFILESKKASKED